MRSRAFRSACPDARWTRPEGIHLTLKFLGEISDAQTKQVVEALGKSAPFEPFSVEVKGFGFFPQARRPAFSGQAWKHPPALADSPRGSKTAWKKSGLRARIASSPRT